jgi:hypothetical protein
MKSIQPTHDMALPTSHSVINARPELISVVPPRSFGFRW